MMMFVHCIHAIDNLYDLLYIFLIRIVDVVMVSDTKSYLMHGSK